MPINPLAALKSLQPGASRQLSPEEQAQQDAQAQQTQAADPAWMQAARRGINGGVGMVKGALGIDDGSQGFSPNHLTQLAGAGMGLLPEGILASLRGVAPAAKAAPAMLGADAAQAASRSAMDVFNPRTMENMENMYHEAKPAFQGLEQAGAFGGDRSVGGIHSLGTGATAGPEFAAVGDEGLTNGMSAQIGHGNDPVQSAYKALLARGGR